MVVYTFEFPSYFEVDFIRNNESSRAIYNRYGNWFETRTKVKELPESIANALKEDGYGDWTWSELKEKIEAPGMIGSVYRLRVSGEGETIQIRYD